MMLHHTFGHHLRSSVATSCNKFASESMACQWGNVVRGENSEVVLLHEEGIGTKMFSSIHLLRYHLHNPTIRLFSTKWNANLIQYWLNRWCMWCAEMQWEWVINMAKMEVESWKLVLIVGEEKKRSETHVNGCRMVKIMNEKRNGRKMIQEIMGQRMRQSKRVVRCCLPSSNMI